MQSLAFLQMIMSSMITQCKREIVYKFDGLKSIPVPTNVSRPVHCRSDSL